MMKFRKKIVNPAIHHEMIVLNVDEAINRGQDPDPVAFLHDQDQFHLAVIVIFEELEGTTPISKFKIN
jgi:hypothetical protein